MYTVYVTGFVKPSLKVYLQIFRNTYTFEQFNLT